MSNQSENRNSNCEEIPQSASDYFENFKGDDDDNDVDESIQSENLDDGAWNLTTLIEKSKHISTVADQSLPTKFRDYLLSIKSESPSYLFDFRQFASCSTDDINASVTILIDEYFKNPTEIQFYRNVFKHIEQKASKNFPINAVFSREMNKVRINSNWDEIVMFGIFLCECYKIRAVDNGKIEKWIENLLKNENENSTIAFLLILNRFSMDSNFLQTNKWKSYIAIVRKLAGFDDEDDDQLRSNSIDEPPDNWWMRDEQQIPAQQEVQQEENSIQLASNSRICNEQQIPAQQEVQQEENSIQHASNSRLCNEYKKSLENSTKFNYNNFEYMTDDETNACVKILIDKIITHPRNINQLAIGVCYYADMLQTLRSLPKDVIKACEATIDKHEKEKFSSMTSWHLINLGKFFGELYAIDMIIIDKNFLIDWIERLLNISNENSFESLVQTMKYCHRKFRFEDDVNFDRYFKMLKNFAIKDSHKAIIDEIEAQIILDDISPPDVFWTQEPQPTTYVRRVSDFRAFIQYLSYDQDDNSQKFNYDSIFDWDYVNRKTNARFIERKMMERRVDVLKLAKFLKNMFMLSFSFGRFIKTLKANLLKRVKTFSISTPLNELRNLGIFLSTITNMYVVDKHLLRAFLARIKNLNPIGNKELLRVELDILRVALLDMQMHDSEKFDEYLIYLVDVGENSEISADNRSNIVRILKNFSDFEVPSVFVELIWKSIRGHRLNSMSSEEYANLTDYKELARIFFMHAISNSRTSVYFANAMSQLCSHDEEGKKFKTQIIYRCQKSFERHHKTEKIIDNDFNEDEAIGTTIFIGELIQRQFLTEKIAMSCMKILDEASDDSRVSYECLGILIKMTKNVFRDENNKKYVNELEVKLKNKKIPLKPHNLRTMREASTSSERTSIVSQNSLNSTQNDSVTSSTNEIYSMFSQFLSELTPNNSKHIAKKMKPILLYSDENSKQYAKIIKKFGYENPSLLPSLISLVQLLYSKRLEAKIGNSLQDDLNDIFLNENSPLRNNLKSYCGFFKCSYCILKTKFIFNIWNQLLTHVKLNDSLALLILVNLMHGGMKKIFDTTRAVHASDFLLVFNNQMKQNHSEEIEEYLRMHIRALKRILLRSGIDQPQSQSADSSNSNESNFALTSAENLQPTTAIEENQRTSDDPYERFTRCLSELNSLTPKKVAKNSLEIFMGRTKEFVKIAKIIKTFAYENPDLIPSIIHLIQILHGNWKLLNDQIELSLIHDLMQMLSNQNSPLIDFLPAYCQFYTKMFDLLQKKNVLKFWNLLLSHVKLDHQIALYILVNIMDFDLNQIFKKEQKFQAFEFSQTFQTQLKKQSSVELKNKLQKLIISLDSLTCSAAVPMRANILALNLPTKFEENSGNLVILQSQLNRQSASTSSENQSTNSTQQFSQILYNLTDLNMNETIAKLCPIVEYTPEAVKQYVTDVINFCYNSPHLSDSAVELIHTIWIKNGFEKKLLRQNIQHLLKNDYDEIFSNINSPLKAIVLDICNITVSMYIFMHKKFIYDLWKATLNYASIDNEIALLMLANLMKGYVRAVMIRKRRKHAENFSTSLKNQIKSTHPNELKENLMKIVRQLDDIANEVKQQSANKSSLVQHESDSDENDNNQSLTTSHAVVSYVDTNQPNIYSSLSKKRKKKKKLCSQAPTTSHSKVQISPQLLSDVQISTAVYELFNELQQKPLKEVKNLILKLNISPAANFQQRATFFCKIAMETDRNLKLLAPLLKFIGDEIIKKSPKDDPLLKAVAIELSKHMNSTEKTLQVSKIYGEFFNHGLVTFDWLMGYLRMPIEENLPSLGLKIVYEIMEISFSHMIVVLLNDVDGNYACASNASISSPEISNIEIFMEIYEKFKYCTRPMDSAFSETLMYDKIRDNFEVIKMQVSTQKSKLQESNSTTNNAYINSSNMPSTSSKSLNSPKPLSDEPKSTIKTSKLIPSTSQSKNIENFTTPVESFEEIITELNENNFEASIKRLSTINHNENATNYDEIIEIFIKIYFQQPFSNDHANLLVKLLKSSKNTFVDHLINQFQHYCIIFITSDDKYRENFIEIIEIIDVMCRFYHNVLIYLDFIAQCIEIYLDKTQKFDTAYDYIYKTLKSTGGDFELSKKDEIDKYFKFFNHIIVIDGKQAKSCAELIELRKDRFISSSSVNYDIFERFIDENVSVSTVRLYINENNTNVDEFMEMIWKTLMKSPQKAIKIANAVADLSRLLNSLQKCLIEFMERRRRTFLGILRKDFTPKMQERLKFSIIFIIELNKLKFLTEDLDDWLLPRLIKKLTKYEDKFEIFSSICSIKYDITNERLEIFIKNLEESMRESQNYTFGEMKNDLNELMTAMERNLNVEDDK